MELVDFLRELIAGPIQSADQVTWKGGDSVRRVERRRRVDWFINGVQASEAEARALTAERDAASREFLGLA